MISKTIYGTSVPTICGSSDHKFHYVYRITNLAEGKHYYGKRSTKTHPYQDLGSKYFSSSHDKEFIKLQKTHPEQFKYKIIAVFNTTKEAVALEVKLHNKFNVGINEAFYNRAKQSSSRFDTTGLVVVRDSSWNTFQVKIDDERYLSGELVHWSKDTVLVQDSTGNLTVVPNTDERYLNGDLTTAKVGFCTPGRIITKEHREKLSKAAKGVPKSKESIQKGKETKKRLSIGVGKNHPRHKYMYVTPLGIYDSPAALEPIISLSRMKAFCIHCDRIISFTVWNNCKWLRENYDYVLDIEGKTYREIGFSTE